MDLRGRGFTARSRLWFLSALPAVCFAQTPSRRRVVPSAITQYPDPVTEFPVSRLTDPAHTSRLPAHYGRAVSRRGDFLLYSSDITGRLEAFRMDLKSGQSQQLTEAEDLDPASPTLLAGERGFAYLDGGALMTSAFGNPRPREVYRIPEGFERGSGFSVAEDGLYAALVEKNASRHRLQLIQMAKGSALKLAESDDELRDPIPRPRRASILYRRAGAVWLVNYDAQQHRGLRVFAGETGAAQWSPDGRTVLYLNYPENPKKLHNLHEFTPDSNTDKSLADTSQFVHFGCNADASVFVGASGSKASPYVLLLVRAVKRELTLAEHRASQPEMVAPIFSPNSQRIFFASDRHGKPAIYAMAVEKLVAETESSA
jgi:oligogalacturonide lyase